MSDHTDRIDELLARAETLTERVQDEANAWVETDAREALTDLQMQVRRLLRDLPDAAHAAAKEPYGEAVPEPREDAFPGWHLGPEFWGYSIDETVGHPLRQARAAL